MTRVTPVTGGLLITGGSGFLGRALVRHLLHHQRYDRIIVYSRGEAAQAMLRVELDDPPQLRWMIGDVRDRERLRWAMRGVSDVIHAAALKRIEVGFYAPSEMVKTNVLGTINLVDAAAYCGVHNVVMVSTDKAWQPVSPYGLSKALAEDIVLAGGTERPGPCYAICRYGNVAGSTGSVIPTWRALLREGKRVPVTNPDATRFWMTVDQAVSFVLTTLGDPAYDGRIRVPILPAYRVGDLAEAMGAQTYTIGMAPFEKCHEGMDEGNTSDRARRMSVDELREALEHV